MPLVSGHLHLQGREGLDIVVAPAIPAGSATYPSPKTPSNLAGPTNPPLLILSESSSPSSGGCKMRLTKRSTQSSPTRGVEIATVMHITNVGAASLMTISLAQASRLTVGSMT